MLVEIKKDEDKNKIIELTLKIAKLEYFCNALNKSNKDLVDLVNELTNKNNILSAKNLKLEKELYELIGYFNLK